MTNSLSFSEKALISPSLFKRYCCRKPRILGGQVLFPFSALERFHCLLACIVSDVNYLLILIIVSCICNVSFFLFAFKIFLVIINLQQFIMMYLNICPAWGLLRPLICVFIVFKSNLESFQPLFLQIYFLFLSLSSPSWISVIIC